ncbi:hypothetical protein, partial [Collinsella sp. 1033st1_B10_1033SCRN_220408]|uniref:hypothetical protein n=1 Tax=Collinsella sp. 1033st1_B10_1033SCRN_220408 TaxID=3143055 RepID=UPI00319E53DA
RPLLLRDRHSWPSLDHQTTVCFENAYSVPSSVFYYGRRRGGVVFGDLDGNLERLISSGVVKNHCAADGISRFSVSQDDGPNELKDETAGKCVGAM